MRRCIFSFFCVFALASCSPKVYSSAQDVRAFESGRQSDSVSLSRLVDSRLELYFEHHLERAAELQQETVTERLSDPDSTGRQWVEERSTTRSVARSQTTSGGVSSQSAQLIRQEDSTAVRDTASVSELETHEESSVTPARKWLPWYVYVGALLVALVLGFILGLRRGRL